MGAGTTSTRTGYLLECRQDDHWLSLRYNEGRTHVLVPLQQCRQTKTSPLAAIQAFAPLFVSDLLH